MKHQSNTRNLNETIINKKNIWKTY